MPAPYRENLSVVIEDLYHKLGKQYQPIMDNIESGLSASDAGFLEQKLRSIGFSLTEPEVIEALKKVGAEKKEQKLKEKKVIHYDPIVKEWTKKKGRFFSRALDIAAVIWLKSSIHEKVNSILNVHHFDDLAFEEFEMKTSEGGKTITSYYMQEMIKKVNSGFGESIKSISYKTKTIDERINSSFQFTRPRVECQGPYGVFYKGFSMLVVFRLDFKDLTTEDEQLYDDLHNTISGIK